MNRSVAITGLALASLACIRAAAAEPAPDVSYLYHVPEARVVAHGVFTASVGGSVPGSGTASAHAGLSGLAEVGIETTDDVIMCADCEGDDRETKAVVSAMAHFKLAINPGQFARWQPGMTLGFRKTFASVERSIGGEVIDPSLAQMYAAVGWYSPRAGITLGASMWDGVSRPGGMALHLRDVRAQVRPFAGLDWTPASFPRTTVIVDLTWVPEIRAEQPELRWLSGLGVRYQALSWISVELGVRAREKRGFDDVVDNLSAFVRLNAVLAR